jgi:hypothetical protein
MSCSVQGIIAFGCVVGEDDDLDPIFHMLEEDGYPDFDEYLLRRFDTSIYNSTDWKLRVDRTRILTDWCPLDLIQFGYHDYTGYFLAWKASITEQESYEPQSLGKDALQMGPYEISKMREWMKKLYIPDDLPLGWNLMAYYG